MHYHHKLKHSLNQCLKITFIGLALPIDTEVQTQYKKQNFSNKNEHKSAMFEHASTL